MLSFEFFQPLILFLSLFSLDYRPPTLPGSGRVPFLYIELMFHRREFTVTLGGYYA
jgi:hypothetical protein